MAVKCRACGGIYQPVTPDGSPYAHVCPPIRLARVERGGRIERVPLDELRPDDVRVGESARDRPNARNENIDPGRARDAAPDRAREELMIAPGLGVELVPDPPRVTERDLV